MPGVVAVLTAATTSGSRAACRAPRTRGGTVRQPQRPMLAEGRVRHVGEPVAIVLATDRTRPATPPTRCVVDYDPLPAVVDAESGRSSRARRSCTRSTPDNLLHDPRAPDRRLRRRRWRRRAAPGHADGHNQRLTPVADGDARRRRRLGARLGRGHALHLDAGAALRAHVRRPSICGTREAKVRVVAPDVGGGFGSKLNVLRRGVRGLRRPPRRRRGRSSGSRRARENDGRHHPRPRPAAGRTRPRSTQTAASWPSALNADPEQRRLPAAADADDRAPHAVHGARRLRHPAGLDHRSDEVVHEHDARPTPTAAPAARRPRTASSG